VAADYQFMHMRRMRVSAGAYAQNLPGIGRSHDKECAMAEPAVSDQLLLELKTELQQRRKHLREEIQRELLRADTETFSELAGRVHDEGDASVADLLADINIAIIGNQVREIRAIETALQRVADGTYGICIDCESIIDPERLAAHPSAQRCFSCQDQHERTHVGAQRPSL
jgi:DnaK suppressor protein